MRKKKSKSPKAGKSPWKNRQKQPERPFEALPDSEELVWRPSPDTSSDASEDAPETAMSEEDFEAALSALAVSAPVQEEEKSPLASPIGYSRKHGGLPATKKSLGQNWLIDPQACLEMAAQLKVGKGDLIVEVGPGAGALTEALLTTGADVLAVEIDQRMVEVLSKRWGNNEQFRVVHEDILQTDLLELTDGRPFAVVGNLPYHITSSLLFNLMDFARTHPGLLKRIVVLLQWEVARRLAAGPSDSEYGILSVFLRIWGEPQLLFRVDRKMFAPPPKVHAGVIGMDVAKEMRYPVPDWSTFKRLVKGAFQKRRKMLRNSIPTIPNLGSMEAIDFDWSRRPQTLSAEEFAWLAEKMIPKRIRE